MAVDLSDPSIEILDMTPRRPTGRVRNGRSQSVEVIAAISAVVVVITSDAAPAGIALADALYRGVFAFVVVWLAARSRRWTWGFMASLASLGAADLLAQLSVLTAALIFVATIAMRRRSPVFGALIAGFSIPALMTQGADPLWRLTGGLVNDPLGSSAIITAIAVAPLVRTGWRTLSRRRRRSIKRVGLRVGIGVGVIFIASGAIAAASLPSMLNGLQELRQGAAAAVDGDLPASANSFDAASQSWGRANRIVSGPWMLPARLIPIAGQNVRAAQVVTGQASALSASASVTTTRVRPDDVINVGRIDLTAIDEAAPAVDALAATADRAANRIGAIDSPWLFAPVASRVERAEELLRPAAGVLGASAEALDVGRDLLSGQSPSNILFMFTTPAEARGNGGFVGSWALARAAQGQLEIERTYRSVEINRLLDERNAVLRTDADYESRYGRFDIERHIQDVTVSPDFPSVARTAASLFEQATDEPIDAVVSMDPLALEALVGFSGPITAGPIQFTGANTARELLVEQYIEFAEDEEGRELALLTLAQELTQRLFESPPDPIAFVTELAPLAEQDRLNIWLADDRDGSIARRLGLAGEFPPMPDDDSGDLGQTGDLLAIVHQNSGQNKIDSFLERRVDISSVIRPQSLTIEHQVVVTLDNSAPSSGLPPAIIASNDQGLDPGTNAMFLSVYSRTPLVGARLDGTPVPVEAGVEFGVPVYSFFLDLGPGDFSTLELELVGPIEDPTNYSMNLAAQPLTRPDSMSWHLQTDDGSRVIAPEGWTRNSDGVRWSGTLDRDEFTSFELRR